MTTALRLGFIGLGRAPTRVHLPLLRPMADRGEVVLAAACDTVRETADREAAAFGVERVFTDHRAMFDQERLDAVFLAVPPTCHSDVEMLAAERGVALFVEKPPTLDLAQAVAYDRVIRDAGIVSQVGFHWRYHETAERAQTLLRERVPRHAQVQYHYSGAPLIYWTSRFELCGGSLVEHGIHAIDLLRFFLGDIAAVSAFYVARRHGEGPVPMNLPHVYTVNLRFECGATANVTLSRVLTNVSVRRDEMIIVSDDSLLEWSPKRLVENGETLWNSPGESDAAGAQIRAFIDAVRVDDPTVVRSPYQESLNSLASVLAANESAGRDGAVVLTADLLRRAEEQAGVHAER